MKKFITELYLKFNKLPYWVPTVVFVIILLIVNFIIGIEYFYFFFMAGLLVGAFMSALAGIIIALGLKEYGFQFIFKSEKRFMAFCSILVLIIFFGLLFISQIPPF